MPGLDATPQTATNGSERRRVRLTKREAEVLSLVILGKSSKEVADALYVSKRTVDFHLANVYNKLNVNNRIQAFHEATRLGLISPDVLGSTLSKEA
jgi:DNA-binding CsgD family transcriptional regulator